MAKPAPAHTMTMPFFSLAAFCLSFSSEYGFCRERSSPFEAIGELRCDIDGRRLTSVATLVNDRKTIIAAGHFSGDPIDSSGANCAFFLGSRGKDGFKTSVSVAAEGGTAMERRISAATDWAVLHLARPAPEAVEPISLVASAPAAGRRQVLLAALDRFRGVSKPKLETCFSVIDKGREAVLRHECPSKPGQSGAPIFTQEGGQLRLVGIHVGKVDEEGRGSVIGDNIRRIVRRGQANL